jgi:hypothetical protein
MRQSWFPRALVESTDAGRSPGCGQMARPDSV